MKKILFLLLVLGFAGTSFATGINKNQPKAKRIHKHLTSTIKKDACTVTVTQRGSVSYADCDGNMLTWFCSSPCTKTGENCDVAFVSANSCASASLAACLASSPRPACQ